MRKRKRMTTRTMMLILACAIIAIPFAISAVHGIRQNKKAYRHSGKESAISNVELGNGVFSTHLPIVVIDTFGDKPHAGEVWDVAKGYRVSVDFDPYANGKLMLIDNKNSLNHIEDAPVLETDIRIKLRGFSSLTYNKSQYFIKMVNEDGTKKKQDVLKMGSEWEWILNISYIDKSLLRNYIGFTVAGQIMPNTPQAQYCEVFFRNGTDYEYKGLYLIMENVKQGPYRVNIAEYDPHFVESSYILCRDRYSESGVMLNNYGTKNGLTYGYLDVRYPNQDKMTDATLRYIEQDVNKIEEALFSHDVNEFLKYRDYIDTQSFIDYFIINEFFANYDAGYNSYFMYKDTIGKLHAGPIWDLDQGTDNNYPYELMINSTAMHDAVWIRQLLRDPEFVLQLTKRYQELRKGVLSDAYIEDLIDETVEFLGPARERDWERWQYNDLVSLQADGVYEKVPESLLVNTRSYNEEIEHMKLVLREHGKWLDENIDSLYQFCEIEPGLKRVDQDDALMNSFFGGDRTRWVGGVMTIVIIIAFFCSIVIAQRE